MNRRLLAALLCLALTAGLLAGCGSNRIQTLDDPAAAEATDAPTEAPAEEAEPTDAPEEADAEATDATAGEAEPTEDAGPTPEPTASPVPGLGPEAYEPDRVVAVFNGQDVTWQEYYYWLSYYVDNLAYLASLGAFTFTGWDSADVAQGNTNADVVRMSAWNSLSRYHAVEELAEGLGVKLDQADRDQIAANFESSADGYGDGDGECTEDELAAFGDYLEAYFMDRALFERMNAADMLYNKSFNALYGEDAADYPDGDALAYAEEQGMLRCKHILVMTIDQSTGEALPEEELADRKAKVDDLYDQLSAKAEDPQALEALFDELMQANSEDGGLAMYPDGYLFTPGTMVPEFEDATAALEDYGLSEPVQSSYGWHIILRLPIEPDLPVMSSTGGSETLRASAADEAFLDRITEVSDSAEVEWKDDFETVDVAAIFGEALS